MSEITALTLMRFIDIFLRPLAKDKTERRIATFFSIRVWHFRFNVNTSKRESRKHKLFKIGGSLGRYGLDFSLFNEWRAAEELMNTSVNDPIGLGNDVQQNVKNKKK